MMLEKFGDMIANRVMTPVYTTFFLISVAIHWKFWVVLFFVSEEAIRSSSLGGTKVDYLSSVLWSTSSLQSTLHSIGEWLLCVFLTYFFIWWFPKFVGVPAYRREQSFKVDMRLAKIDEESRITERQSRVLKEKVDNVKLEEEVVSREVKLEKTLEKAWIDEYAEFTSNPLFESFDEVLQSLYRYQGYIESKNFNNITIFRISESLLAYCDSNGLVELSADGNRIKPTEKGKFFIKQFTTLKG